MRRARSSPRHELVGGIAILPEPDPEAARLLIASRPSIRTVVAPEGHVEGPYRTRRFSVLAGEPTTVTEVREHGLVFRVDLAEVYFSARLSTERQRLAGLVEPGERVLDMFAGAGPFALTLARTARFVAASDINPAAVAAMIENCRRNRIDNVLPVLADAARLPALFTRPFDRVIMNLPLSPLPFLPAAFCTLPSRRDDPPLPPPVRRGRGPSRARAVPGCRRRRAPGPVVLTGPVARSL